MYGFDPTNVPPFNQYRIDMLVKWPAVRRQTDSLTKAMDNLQGQIVSGRTYPVEIENEIDEAQASGMWIVQTQRALDASLNNAIEQAIRDRKLTPADVQNSGLAALPVLVVATLLVGGVWSYYVIKEWFAQGTELQKEQNLQQIRINLANAHIRAFNNFYAKNPNTPVPPLDVLVKEWGTTPTSTVDKAINLGTLALIVGGIYLASKTFGGSRS